MSRRRIRCAAGTPRYGICGALQPGMEHYFPGYVYSGGERVHAMDESAAGAAPRSDAELITAAASGDTAAYGVLRERHKAAARSLAGLLSADPAEAEEIAADAFTRLWGEIRERSGPAVALRPRLFLAVRWAAYRRWPVQQAGPGLPGAGGEADTAQDSQEPMFAAPAVAGMIRSPLNSAYLSRPQRSRAVLWHLDTEQTGPAETAAILGLTQDGVFEFAGEARAGLRQSYLSQYVAGTQREDCASAMATLGTRAEGQLTGLDEPAVAQHLSACPGCRAAVGDLSDLGESLRRVVAPIYLGSAAAAYLQASLGGLHWTGERSRPTGPAPRSRRVLAAACGLLAAGAATGLALALTGAAGPAQHTAAQDRPPAVTPSSPPGSAPAGLPGSASAGPAPGAGPSGTATPAGSPASASPSPSPTATAPGSPSPRPTVPLPTPARHHRHHHLPFP
jgi:DNA-directed RNA polymerase specialized sigma24 family protein